MANTELVTYTRKGRVAELRFNRPEKLNALSHEMVVDLSAAMYRFDADPEAWVAIFSGEGRAFCAGADVSSRIGSAAGRGVGGGPKVTVFLNEYEHMKPVIAAVHGYAYGAGFRFVLHSDLSIADTTAKFQLSEIARGIDASQLWAEMNLRGFGSFADDIAISGRACGAQEAYERGVICRVVPEGKHIEGAYEMADQVLSNPPLAVRAMVRTRRSRLRQLEAQTAAVRQERTLHLTNDFRESVAALTEKRKPVFTGT